jgi:hypothetical protein
MRRFGSALAVLVTTTAGLPALLAHCGGDSGSGSNAADAAKDGPAEDGTMQDAVAPDVTSGADSGANDASGDSPGSEDAADANQDTGIDATPCTVVVVADAGDAGDAGEAGDDGGAGDAGDSGDASDAGDAGGSASGCGPSQTCCGGWCTDTSKDPRNCGACGNACSANQFCTGVACDDAVLKNICANPSATVVFDQYMVDDTAGTALGNALSTICMPAVKVASTEQDSGLAQDPSGRPITGVGNTLVAGGGWFGQASAAYMDSHGLTPLIVGTDGTNAWIRSAKTMGNIVSVLYASLTMHHDYFLFELAVEPISGSLCFYGYGMGPSGTAVASYYFQNNVLPMAFAFPDRWYIYEWVDTDMNGLPSAADMFSLVDHGM